MHNIKQLEETHRCSNRSAHELGSQANRHLLEGLEMHITCFQFRSSTELCFGVRLMQGQDVLPFRGTTINSDVVLHQDIISDEVMDAKWPLSPRRPKTHTIIIIIRTFKTLEQVRSIIQGHKLFSINHEPPIFHTLQPVLV